MTFGYVQITKARAKRAIATFTSIKDLVDEMNYQYPSIFEMLGVLVSVSDGDLITINAEAANAVYWVMEYSHLARQQVPMDDTPDEEKELLLEINR